MATYNGDNYDVAEDFDPSSENKLGRGLWSGNVKVQVDSYTINAAAAATKVNIAKLPEGAVFIAGLVRTEGLGSGVTLACGDSGDADRYLAAASVASAGVLEMQAIAGLGFQMTADTDIVLVTAGATTASSDKVIKTFILYSL